MVKTFYFLAIMLTAIAMGAALAHLFELPNKIDLGAADYLTVQRNYDNWWIVGLSVSARRLERACPYRHIAGHWRAIHICPDCTLVAHRRTCRVLGLHRAGQPRDR